MSEASDSGSSRRDFFKNTGRVAAASTLIATTLGKVPHVHAASDNTIQLALIGCGGRGTGAARNALSVKTGPTKLVAVADVFPDRMNSSYQSLKLHAPDKVDVPDDRKFVGFDAYKAAMDCLKPGDIAILTTPPAFRWVQFTYAIQKGINVFMEKPVTVDGPASRRMLELAKQSVAKNMKVGVGLMCRHCTAREEMLARIKDGEIGDITMMRAYRMAGPTATAFAAPKPENMNELEYQIRNFHAFLWLSGGAVSDFLIHNIDECCWIKGAWPVKAMASGGRHYRGNYVDQNFDSYSIEYTFEDGTKLFMNGRTVPNCHNEFASYAHGTKGMAVISASGHSPSKCRTYKGHDMKKENLLWQAPQPELDPYQTEWERLTKAIREDKPHNEAERGVIASVVTSMGRMAAHTGQTVTYDDMLNCAHEFGPDIDKLTLTSASPLVANAEGKYPVPLPGINPSREY